VNQDVAVHLATNALTTTLEVSMPFLLAGLLVGVVISVFQAITQIQEMTLTFIPKILVTALVVAIAGPWMLDRIVGYTHDLFVSIPTLAGQ
jgi:flagellar biosynthetic protein FliQ